MEDHFVDCQNSGGKAITELSTVHKEIDSLLERNRQTHRLAEKRFQELQQSGAQLEKKLSVANQKVESLSKELSALCKEVDVLKQKEDASEESSYEPMKSFSRRTEVSSDESSEKRVKTVYNTWARAVRGVS